MKTVTMLVKVAQSKIADVLEMLTDVTESVTVQTGGSAPDIDDVDVIDLEPTRRPRDVRKVVTMPGRKSSAPRTRLAGKVIYTPVGTQRQLDKLMQELSGVKSVRAFVMRDLVKHPGSSNAEVRARIGKSIEKIDKSVESVDNVIWQMVNNGQITKQSADAE